MADVVDIRRAALHAAVDQLTDADLDRAERLAGKGAVKIQAWAHDQLSGATASKGGQRGGRARAANMTQDQRREAAKRAALARWGGGR